MLNELKEWLAENDNSTNALVKMTIITGCAFKEVIRFTDLAYASKENKEAARAAYKSAYNAVCRASAFTCAEDLAASTATIYARKQAQQFVASVENACSLVQSEAKEWLAAVDSCQRSRCESK